MKTTTNITAIIPAYNEANRIGLVIERVKAHVQHVIVVNDASKDNTALVAQQHGAQVINLTLNEGAGAATRIGCETAIQKGADIIVTIDADGQHHPDEIPLLVTNLLQQNAGIVFGGRQRTPNMPIENRWGNRLLSVVSSHLFGTSVGDTLTGFRAFFATAFPAIKWESNRYSFVAEMAAKVAHNKVPCKEVTISTIYHDNKKGMRKRDGIKTLFLLFWWKITW